MQAKAEKLSRFIPAGSRVAFMEEQPVHEAELVLALIRLQVTVVPIALKYGEQRALQILEHTQPEFLYTGSASLISEACLQACIRTGTTIIADQTICLHGSTSSLTSRHTSVGTMRSSMIMYTSGSTGKPKGAVLPYESIEANIRDIQTYWDIHEQDHLLIHRSLSHASVMTGELLHGVISGSRLTFYQEVFLPRRMLSFMERRG
ncbi:long-chain fatty acid--CoA ligase [Paenibacillus hexagrammi]|uniref:Long-chain fatty acid--CoA ligase n=1 Tax=Paenibacillus hexagrammi TaxID=2908839 RepID=A0ABY3SDZ7_9BACL|nr:AMP-binding protein [Paenibacillus sp. YPD9-1]UJF31356.1 long-chain fatty acid--CoA ligase [Paenibacillus sp. YPD9-1]